MPLQPLPHRLKFGFILLACCLVFFSSVIVGWILWQGREVARRQATISASNVLVSLGGEITRTFEVLDLALLAAVRGARMPGIDTLPPDQLDALLFDGGTQAEGYGAVAITDANGIIKYASGNRGSTGTDLGDRDYFKIHRATRGMGLIVSQPLLSRSDGGWSVALARRLDTADGGFAGVAVGTIRLEYLQQVFRRLNLGPGGTVSLFSTDGWLLSSMPERVSDTSHNVASDPLYQRVNPGPGGVRAGSFEATSLDDGVHRIHVYQRLGAFPLVASIGVSTDAVFADWFMGAIGVLGLFTLFAFLLGALVWALRQELARRAIAEHNARHSAASLRATVARLDAWFSNTPDALMLVRVVPGGALIYEAINTGFLNTFAIDAAAVLGNGPQAFCPPDTAEFILAKWHECVATRLPMRYTVHFGHLARATELEVHIAPILGDDGAVTGIVGGGRDVTERSMVEGRLRQFQKLQLVGQLTAGVAHDFNNLLQAIIGGIDMLDETAGNDPETQQILSIIRRSAFRGATLTNRLLTVSRKQSLDPALCDTTDLLDEVGELCAASLSPIVEIKLEKEPGTWPVMVDPTQLTTCLMNLAVNAHHAMPSGGCIAFAARNANAAESGAPDGLVGDYVVLEVRDTGCGMTGAVLEKACDPFFTTKDVGKGTGLGLSMALGFTQQSGGALAISSKPGLGTTVRIWLPRAAADVQSALPSAGGASKDPRHILLVDDDTEVGPVLRMMLVTAGYAVTLANSGTEALSLIKATGPANVPFGALVTDYAMPGMNGAELAELIQQYGVSIPILMVTGYHDAAGADHRLPTGIRILRKPIRYDELLMQVGALFHAHTPTAFTQSPNAGNVVPLRTRGSGSSLL